jgi:hypothetical protein
MVGTREVGITMPAVTKRRLPGRNLTTVTTLGELSDWSGDGESGDLAEFDRPVVRKEFVETVRKDGDARRRYDNTVAWDSLRSRDYAVLSPAILRRDDTSQTVWFEYVAGISLAELLSTYHERAQKPLPEPLLEELGRSLGNLHSLPRLMIDQSLEGIRTRQDKETDPQIQSSSSADGLTSMSLHHYENASRGEVEAWRLIQRDDVLTEALKSWHSRLAREPMVPSHGDFRLDNVLYETTDNAVCILDWEEFGLAPQSRDLTNLVGGIIHTSLFETFRWNEVEPPENVADAHRAILESGEAALKACQPLVLAFLRGYESSSPMPVDKGQLARGCGWFMIERMIARSVLMMRVEAMDRGIAGIGRQALLNPELLADLLTEKDGVQ